ncbi:MAG TPA: hypothetical protein PLG15_05510 [Candidatus Gastranaerophilaceae bacterium]|nr:hypothetical protein [Candidatus Gastranaerophilaceae bacterium]HPT41822.1 hypothetical protein [Candidatus Gastranaerophilaceae bacterium]
MISSKVKVLVIISALLLSVGLMSVGCKSAAQKGWVNTDSMPGHTFSKHKNKNNQNTQIVYLGASEKDSSTAVDFGPQDVSFEFSNLK